MFVVKAVIFLKWLIGVLLLLNMKLLYFIGLSVLSILGLPLTTAKFNNDAPNNTFIEALTFAVAADKWTEFKNINWDFFTAMVTL